MNQGGCGASIGRAIGERVFVMTRKQKLWTPSCLVLAAALAASGAASAQPAAGSVAEVVVTGSASASMSTAVGPNPSNTVTRDGLAVFGGPAQISSFQAAQLVPGVIANSADPYGLSFTRALNVRGKSDFFLSRDIDGLPLAGIVGGADLFDLEDVAIEKVYAGAILADQGFGVSNATGVLDQTLLGPQAQRGATLSQGFGSFDFRRTFARIDTGELSTGTSLFASGSTTIADKWKGAGNAWRNNVALGVSQAVGDTFHADLYYVHNVQKADSYLGLSYAQTQSLGANYNADYLTSLSGVTASNRNKYYDLNKQVFTDDATFANLTYKLPGDGMLSVKPYYWHDVGVNESASGTQVRYWPQDKDNYGAVAEYDGRLTPNLQLSTGYWFQSMSPDPPPVKQKNYNVNADGSLAFASWATLGEFGRHQFSSPFVQLTGTFGQTEVTGGARYLLETAPSMTYFKTTGLPDSSYSAALAANPPVDPNAVNGSRNYYIWLPNAGVHQQFTNELALDVSYSKKVARVDYGPQASTFLGAESAFVKQGITLNTLMNDLHPETDDVVDAVLSYNNGHWIVSPDLYVYKAHDKEVLILDPRINQAYYQSNTGTTGVGLDLSVGYRLSSAFTAFVGASIAKETYDANVLLPGTGAPTTLAIKGKQAPNDPETTLKASITYKADGFTITPVVRYIGSRYGLADNSQKVPGSTIADLTASYDLSRWVKAPGLTFNLSVLNLFDTKYIDVISVNEDNLSSTNYFAGAPRTVAGSLVLKF